VDEGEGCRWLETSRVEGGGVVMRQRVVVGKEAVEVALATKGINLSDDLIVKLLMPNDDGQHEGNSSTIQYIELK
jgi:hypothetical protein